MLNQIKKQLNIFLSKNFQSTEKTTECLNENLNEKIT